MTNSKGFKINLTPVSYFGYVILMAAAWGLIESLKIISFTVVVMEIISWVGIALLLVTGLFLVLANAQLATVKISADKPSKKSGWMNLVELAVLIVLINSPIGEQMGILPTLVLVRLVLAFLVMQVSARIKSKLLSRSLK